MAITVSDDDSEFGGAQAIIQPLPHELEAHENRMVQQIWCTRTAGQNPLLPENDLVDASVPREAWAAIPAKVADRLPTEQPPVRVQ